MPGYGTGAYGAGLYGTDRPELPNYPTLRPALFGVRRRLWLADRYGNKLEQIPTRQPVNGTISFNEDEEFKRSFSLEVNDPDRLPGLRTWVIPEISLSYPSGETRTRAMGHFLLTPGPGRLSRTRHVGSLQGVDITWLLANAESDGMTIFAGTDLGAAARDVCLSIGLTRAQVQIPDIGVILAEDKFIDPGTKLLSIANGLLNTGNWYAVWTNWLGQIVTGPWLDLQQHVPSSRYANDSVLRILPDVNEEPIWDRLRNTVYVIKPAQGDQPMIWGKASITNRSHPLFYDKDDPAAGLGFQRSETVIDPDIPDAAAAQARAESLLSKGASYHRKLRIRTILDLDADGHDVIELDVRRGRKQHYGGSWWRRTWIVRLQGLAATMDSEMYRVEKWQ